MTTRKLTEDPPSSASRQAGATSASGVAPDGGQSLLQAMVAPASAGPTKRARKSTTTVIVTTNGRPSRAALDEWQRRLAEVSMHPEAFVLAEDRAKYDIDTTAVADTAT